MIPDDDTATPGGVSAPPDARRVALATLALALGGFGIGVTEFAAMGLLRRIAEGYGITEPEAGHVISAYALGVVVGAPLITVLGARLRRRTLLLGLMTLFAVANAAAALSPSPAVLLGARFLAGIPHGAYFGVASLVAAQLAGPGRQARAASMVMMGLSVANVVGVPLATLLGGTLGWQSAFLAVGVIGLVTVASIWVLVPEPQGLEPTHPLEELSALTNGQVLATLAVGTVGFGGMFAVYTYIQWTMVEVAGIPASWMPAVLALYGLGMVAGNFAGGVIADRDLDRGLLGLVPFMIVVLAAFALAVHNPVTALVGLFLVGTTGSALVPGLQARLMAFAGRGKSLAAALNHSALNVANALGAWIGGLVIAAGFGYAAPALAGSGLAVLGLAVFVPAVLAARRAGADGGRPGERAGEHAHRPSGT